MQIAQTFMLWAAIIGGIAAGGIKIFELFSGALAHKRKYASTLDHEIIEDQDRRIKILNTELSDVRQEQVACRQKINILTAENNTLRSKYDGILEIIQGRDKNAQEMFSTIKRIDDNFSKLTESILVLARTEQRISVTSKPVEATAL